MKVKVISRSEEEYTRERTSDLRKVQRNYDPQLHQFEKAKEYTRALNAAKLDRIFAKPFIAALPHDDGVTCLARNPRLINSIVAGAADGDIRIWDIPQERVLRRLVGHTAAVKGISFAPDGETVVSASTDATVKLWKVPYAPFEAGDVQEDAEPVFEFSGKNAFRGIDHHWDRTQFATAGAAVDIWDHSRSEPIQTFTWGSDTITSVRFNPVRGSGGGGERRGEERRGEGIGEGKGEEGRREEAGEGWTAGEHGAGRQREDGVAVWEVAAAAAAATAAAAAAALAEVASVAAVVASVAAAAAMTRRGSRGLTGGAAGWGGARAGQPAAGSSRRGRLRPARAAGGGGGATRCVPLSRGTQSRLPSLPSSTQPRPSLSDTPTHLLTPTHKAHKAHTHTPPPRRRPQAEADTFASTGSDRSIALYDLRRATPLRKVVMQVGSCGGEGCGGGRGPDSVGVEGWMVWGVAVCACVEVRGWVWAWV